MTEKIDPREVYGDDTDAICHPPVCECEDCKLPLPHNGYADGEQAAYYDSPAPPKEWHRGPDSCENYWNNCECKRCIVREQYACDPKGV